METISRRRARSILTGFFLLIHPLPVALHTLAVTLLALLAAWPTLLGPELLLLIGAHTAMQMAIAILNDYCDRKADAQGRKRKPIPLGLVTPREALFAGLVCIGLMLLLLLPLNRLALLLSLLYLGLGLAYNLGLKATPFSGVIFALAIPLIPVYAFVGVGRIVPILGWFIPVAALLGVAINLANSLPDLEDDQTNRLRTLAVVLGLQRSYLLCTLCMLSGTILIVALALIRLVPMRALLLLIIACIALPAIVLSYFYGKKKLAKNMRQRYFYIVVSICLLLAVSWIVGALL